MTLLIKNGYVVTMDSQRSVFERGFVEVAPGGTIGRVGAMADCPAGATSVFDATGMLVLPGLINLQHRNWQHLVPRGVPERFSAWEEQATWLEMGRRQLKPGDVRAAATLAAAELVATGTTCVVHECAGEGQADIVDAELEPGLELGLRQVLALDTVGAPLGSTDLCDIERNFEKWHGTRGGLTWLAGSVTADAVSIATRIATEQHVLAGYIDARERRISLIVRGAAGVARHAGDLDEAIRKTGRSEVVHLMELGALDERVLLCDGGALNDLDCSLLAEAGAHVVYSPTREAMRGAVTPVSRLLSMGVNCALGTDGPALTGSVDMVEQIKACAMIQNTVALDPGAMSIERALEMATIDAARAIGLAHAIGSLEPGKQADVAVFDMRDVHMQVVHKPLSNFFCCGRGHDARLVLVAGRTVVGDDLPASSPASDLQRDGARVCAQAFQSQLAQRAHGVL
ncbi:amidohydrolase family protein [Variovorax sp. Sphag1AA]|uniref:amidohydrolase family protein n=1 Tax=Variovorax sp. Sphag1AA TaxID=2587027 RepID=UPI0016160DE8|nr:amidohydrolase family protein [Variovorax sp. Sphag1AA]MBB3181631.1 5-methylthioadenosine/S-adenosylhomocysteine deaminase [Variovorax sp. Sphag1AA]